MTGQPRESRLRVAVTGLAATYPYGGVFWDYVQFALGLHRLGHEVLYVEDTGQWCYSPEAATFVEDGAVNAQVLDASLRRLAPELADRWYFRDARGAEFGRPWQEVVRFCDGADLFLHVSASCLMRDEYRRASTVAFIDSDPLYTQAGIFGLQDGAVDEERARWWRDCHDVFFTFGENVGAADCLVPLGGLDWLPTRQPLVLDCFADDAMPLSERRRVLTTVASWEPREDGPVIGGIRYAGKSTELERFADLPAHSPLPLELAMSGPAPVDRLRAKGWRVRDALGVSGEPEAYRSYLASSFAEWSVAKNAYVASRSGWFSCRTACYLALGVPAVVQDTGFQCTIPAGQGVLAFSDMEGAVRALEALVAAPDGHSRHAVEIAREYFAHDRVLPSLLKRALSAPER